MDPDTLTFLLSGGHLSVPERQARGLSPHPPLKFDDLVAHIVAAIENQGYFPSMWKGEPGMGVIERRSPNQYVRRAIAEVGVGREEYCENIYASAEEAAREYLHWNLGLPKSGDLDSWRVV